MKDISRHPFPDFYHPLAPKFIRVLELDAGRFSDPIVGRLVPQAMDTEPYEAISYVWGDPQKRRNITIDGETLSVTENLHGALTAFRHRPVAGNSEERDVGKAPAQRQPVRRLWVDAVCINQDDLQERLSQVKLMSFIYAGASRVLSWLGWETSEVGRFLIQDAIRFIHDFMKDPEAGLCDARILLHHDYLADPTANVAHLSEDDRRRFENQAYKWEAVRFFFEIEYFHRAWIVQELGLARQALLITALKPADEHVDTIDWELTGRFVQFLDYRGATLVTHLGLASWVAHHIVMVWATKEDDTPKCDFLTAMHWTRILGVTDPRDRVFSLLGHPMAVLGGEPVIQPDYTCTRGVIYTRLAVNFIQKTKNLQVVSFVDHEIDPSLEQMPSWVPDWHSINRTTPIDYPIDATTTKDEEISFEGGVNCENGTSLPQLLVRGWVVDEISTVSSRMETTDFPVTHLARERTKQNPFWLDRVWELIYPAEQQGNTFTGPGGDALAVLESFSIALSLGTREKDDPASDIGSNQALEEHHRSYLPVRSVFDSLPAEVQVELRQRAEGATAGGFLECMTWPSMCRIVYRTASGLVGMGSRVTRPGDLVCRVRGSAVLMTLRRTDDINASEVTGIATNTKPFMSIHCAHIGSTVVPARMKRGVIDGAEFGEKAANFRII
ncbi:heterokaryon incompatibility protein-domain-containing protein [Bipolaris maydis]|nr:heterokaryon incompatibility protein-domain-containing protein [Bipolaris maydis]KAJ6194161.1 heterokaryon incompatibility protein-domain-containing protein [Bipolaris maydis]